MPRSNIRGQLRSDATYNVNDNANNTRKYEPSRDKYRGDDKLGTRE